MARYGVLGDIHGNREGLEAVLRALDARAIDKYLCVGDIVGYNADPDECVEIVRQRGAVCIAGNHELIGLGKLDFKRCSNNAEYALRRTRRTLGREAAAWLDALPPHLALGGGVVLVHGGVRDVQQYMAKPAQVRDNAAYLREDFPGTRFCFFGHSHEQRVYEVDGNEVRQLEGDMLLLDGPLYFINPGSVDASRKSRHKLAECAIFDDAGPTIEFLSVRYDAAATEAKAAAHGYRIGPITNRLYNLRRRLAARLR